MRLSVLICSLSERCEARMRLMLDLEGQIERAGLRGDVEVLACVDPGVLPIGAKRNQLVDAARGEYCCFVDDDDAVTACYVPQLHEACCYGRDCVGIVGSIWWRGKWKRFEHSLRHPEYREDETAFYRPPNHLNPVRMEIARAFRFPAKNEGEDFDYAMAMQRAGALKTEVFVPDSVYLYTPSEKHR